MYSERKNIFKIDWTLVLVYIFLVGFGLANILSSSISGENISLFDFNALYGKQFIFILSSLLVIIITLTIEVKFYERFSSIFYLVCIFFVLGLFIFGKEVNGALSWYSFNNLTIQPSEFMKVGTALAISKFISDIQINMKKLSDQLKLLLIIILPLMLIILQNDTGTSIVFFSLFFVLYREGISQIYLLIAFIILSVSILTIKTSISTAILLSLIIILLNYLYKKKKSRRFMNSSMIFLFCIFISFLTDYSYKNILKTHQRNYISVWLNLEKDPIRIKQMKRTILYNLNESEKAISSGGFTGKGYLEGTRTIGNFVPEQHSDYIFSTIGEEWGFVGSSFIIILYIILILRIVALSELQKNNFSRIYGYSVASIIFIHFMINIGMVLGLTPTIGIPLPFLSYGGSSLLAFTLLLFIFIRLDANRINEW
ncbi:MAG: rod shape-determining protein RodA [Flavobacteriaceae bacterium]|jgi:rod shape determining protein RodA|nr:rod shape-determining protein RodA [Flavobacteriaceae bacterium]MBT4113045.1 rod shape-determining protein RodA [Flavobacteriaceae bacterium]MBT4613964.1 rod shape-determining protein RodA [Flavobacteriaceae bacterium]MBT5246074.1 rod shape-determining protein RodA [Flavobacteriaceae bacterium]MBT5650659.1 rod shape-determining protein RodA [Flavobacteriaceae bacterium]